MLSFPLTMSNRVVLYLRLDTLVVKFHWEQAKKGHLDFLKFSCSSLHLIVSFTFSQAAVSCCGMLLISFGFIPELNGFQRQRKYLH